MRTKPNYLLTLLAAIILLPSVCFSQQPNPKIWEPFGYNSYYNKKIIKQSPDRPLVWTYKTISDNVKSERIEGIKKFDLEKAVRYRNYHHETVLWEIDCKNKLIMMKEFIDFDGNGKVLDRFRYNDSKWEMIVPGSGSERLYQNVCITREKPSQKKK